MKTRSALLYPLLGLIVLGALLSALGLVCALTARRQPTEPTRRPTVRVLAATHTPRPTATLKPPSPTHTKPQATPTPTSTSLPKEEPTQVATPETLRLVDPAPEELSKIIAELPSGVSLEMLFHEKYVEEQALVYLDSDPELPLPVGDIEVIFEPGEVTVSAIIPLGFLRVEALARSHWTTSSCRLDVDITEVEIGGAAAPATLRKQVMDMVDEGLEGLAKAPLCFTRVQVRDGEIEVAGYKK